jgi:hypothetical protein
MAVTPDGATLYVAAFGSSKVGVFDTTQLENDTFTPTGSNYIPVSGGGPSGVLVRGSRLYVSTRFDNAISVVDTGSKAELQHLPVYSPEPTSVEIGRPVLYDAVATSSNGEAACAACHVFADFDSLAWDLGNPDDTTLNNPNPIEFNFGQDPDFKPLKGPMTTQSLRGMANHGPMHWRGDRTGGNDPGGDPLDENAAFNKFIVAFQGLLGRTGPIPTADMQKFADFILQVTYPPNPIRSLDNSLTAQQQAGRDLYFGRLTDTVRNCNGCHTLDPAAGFFGTDGDTSFENEPQMLKIPHLRNLYQKVGMFGMPQVPFLKPGNNGDLGDQVRGFGFLHDGSVDTLFRFHRASVFDLTVTEAEDMERFVLAFDSNLAPIVGQQITLTSTNGATVGPRIDLMIARAAATPSECVVVAKGVVLNGTIWEQRGAYRLPSGSFRTDRTSEPLLTDGTLRGLAATPGQELTYTCAPPGSGVRMGVDRDEDGYFDRDEIDAGSDPADPASVPSGGTTTTSTTSPTTTSTSTTSTTLPASGQAISGRKLVLVDDPADASRRKAKAVSRDPGIDLGLGNGSVDDPVLHGALVGIFSAAGGFAGFYPLPASNWRYTGTSTNPGYKYVDKLLANGPIKVAVVKSGKLVKVSGRGAVLNLSLAANPDPVSVQLVLGASKLYCMSFDGTTTFTASKKYVAREAPAPATCP